MQYLSLFLLSLLLTACVYEDTGDSMENVNFSQVQALDYRPADHRLSYGPDALQFGELWLPDPPTQDSALLVLIHGGCWLNEFGVDYIYPLSTALAEAGFVVFALEYRRVGDAGGGWPGTFTDIQAGIRYTPRLEALDVNTGRLAILGHSAGGHLALLAGVELDRQNQPAELVVGLAAITDLAGYARGSNSCQSATPLFMGTTPDQDPGLYARANPAQQPIPANTWLLQGEADSIVPVSQAQLPGASSLLVPGAGHFDWVHPGTPAFQRLLELLHETF